MFIAALLTGSPGVTTALAADFTISSAAELDAIRSQLSPGDTIYMTDGVWTDQNLRFRGSGAAQSPITLRAQTPGGVTLTGGSWLEIGGQHLVVEGLLFENGVPSGSSHVIRFTSGGVNATNCVLRDTAIVNYNPPSIDTRYFWVSLYGQNNTVENCYFENQNHSGVTVVVWGDWPNNHIIRNNHFVDRPEGPENGWETIRIGTSSFVDESSRTLVESNLFERCDGEIEIISNKTGDNIYRYNTFLESKGTLTLRHSFGAIVESNYFLGKNRSGMGGVRVIGPGHRIWNNHFQDIPGRTDGIIAIEAGEANAPNSGYEPVTDVIIANNTFVDNGDPAFNLARSLGSDGRTVRPSNVLITGNLVSNQSQSLATATNSNITWTDNAAFVASAGTAPAATVLLLNQDPLAADANGIQRLIPNSVPNGGLRQLNPLVLDDIDGQSRLSPFDFGADEIEGGNPTRSPLAPGEVGPSWMMITTPPVDGPDNSRATFIEAEEPDTILDPDGNGEIYTVAQVQSASNGAVLKSPGGSRSEPPTLGSIAVYSVVFPEEGTFTAYYKARGFNGSTDSFYRPAAFAVDPTVNDATSNNGQFRWEQGADYAVTDSSISYELRIGRREAETEIDAIILFPSDTLTDQELDALLAAGPPEPCPVDLNNDNEYDIYDLLVYLSLFDQDDPSADMNGNGSVNSFDLFRYLSDAEAGCP